MVSERHWLRQWHHTLAVSVGRLCPFLMFSIVWADAHTGATMRVEKQFLHNTKITGSAINENAAFNKSRGKNHPTGRNLAHTELLQQVLNVSDIFTTFLFAEISTRPLEYRPNVKLSLDRKGKLREKGVNSGNPDPSSTSSVCACAFVRRHLELDGDRQMTQSQVLTFRSNVGQGTKCDKVSEFGLRPPEFLEFLEDLGIIFDTL